MMTHGPAVTTMAHTEPPSGLLLVDKPQGVTSFDVVAAVRSALHIKKVGHAGTLDPMATGLLVVGFGHATRLLNVIAGRGKTYEATIRLGLTTDTDDAEAGRCERGASSVDGLSRERIESVIAQRFTGPIEQVPNSFSAIKINGRRAYELARAGQQADLQPRPVTIDEFRVLRERRGWADVNDPACALVQTPEAQLVPVIDLDVRVSCSSGTYIRALARDLGVALATGGYLTRLRRTRVGRFALPDDAGVSGERFRAVTAHAEPKTVIGRDGESITRQRAVLDIPADARRDEWLRSQALTMLQAVRGSMPTVAISERQAAALRFGQRIELALQGDAAAYVPQSDAADVVAIVTPVNAHQAKPTTVFPVG